MAETLGQSPLGGIGTHRANEIGVHQRAWWESAWLLLALAVLALALLAFFAFGGKGGSAPAIGTDYEPSDPLAMAPPTGEICQTSAIKFDSLGSALDKDDRESIAALAECLKANPGHGVRLEGRIDPGETLAGYNTLAQSRADAVATELSMLGVRPSQVMVVTSAATCSETDDLCWHEDRSVRVTALP